MDLEKFLKTINNIDELDFSKKIIIDEEEKRTGQ